jgi:hypothetical protein
LTEVATWAIETEETRFEMQEVVPIGSGGSVQVAVGRTMTFAIDGRKTATIKAADGTTFRVLITRQTPRKKP